MSGGVDSGSNPWKTMWIRPSGTVGHLVQNRPGHRVLFLAALAGMSGTLLGAWMQNLGDSLSVQLVILNAVLVGSLWGIALLYLGGLLVAWTGKWLDGRGDGREIRTALAWGSLPAVSALALWIVAPLFLGDALFTSGGAGTTGAGWALVTFALALGALSIWSLVLTVSAVGRVQGFSAWKALGNLGLATAFLVVPVAVVSSLI